MYRFKTKPQNLPELFVDALNLFGHGMREVWVWSLIVTLFGYLSPHYIVTPTLNYLGNDLHFSVNWTVFIAIILSSVPSAFCVAMITRRYFVLGAKHRESNLGSMKIVMRKLPRIYGGLIAASVFTMFGWLFFFIPGIIFAVTFIFTMPLILLDDYALIRALRVSFDLVWDDFWRALGMFIFPALVIAINYSLPTTQMPLLIKFLQGMVMWFCAPLLLAFILTLFYDEKIRHNIPLHLQQEFVDEDWDGVPVTETSSAQRQSRPKVKVIKRDRQS